VAPYQFQQFPMCVYRANPSMPDGYETLDVADGGALEAALAAGYLEGRDYFNPKAPEKPKKAVEPVKAEPKK
jgi:hypothetical protein